MLILIVTLFFYMDFSLSSSVSSKPQTNKSLFTYRIAANTGTLSLFWEMLQFSIPVLLKT